MSLGLWDEPLALVHNLTGTLIGMVHIMLPFLVLPVLGAMRSIDRDYLKAAANLGRRARSARSGRCSFRCRCPGSSPAR